MSFNYSDKKKQPKVAPKSKTTKPDQSLPGARAPRDGKDLLEAVGKVQQKRDSLRKKKKKSLLPPQAEKQPGEDE